MRNTLRAIVPVAVLATLILTGCATGNSPDPSTISTKPDSGNGHLLAGDEQAASIEELFSGIHYDYDPATSTKQLAKWSAVTVSGKIKTIQEGRISGSSSDQIVDAHTIVVVLEGTKVVSGSAKDASSNLIYVELPSPGGRPAADYLEALPVGTPIVAYLLPAPSGTESDAVFQNPTAGRPDGVTLYMPSNPQSLIVGLKSGGVSLLLEKDAATAKLSDTLPGGKVILGVD